jgi:glycosyltransferase involved in cell wall biosynthesis
MIAAEALLTGVPVLTTRCGGPEAFVNESNGIVVNTEDEIELKNALEYMFLEYGNFDRQKIVDAMGNKFSKTAVGAQFTSLYQEILS